MKTVIIPIVSILFTEPAFACHHFTRWTYPWPQHCPPGIGHGLTAPARIRPTSAPALFNDRSWYVELTRIPPVDPVEILKQELQERKLNEH